MSEDLNTTEVEVEEMPIILRVPKDSVAIELISTMFDENGELTRVSRKISVSEIYQCRQDFLDNVEFGDDYDAVYTLTEEGRAYAEKLRGEI